MARLSYDFHMCANCISNAEAAAAWAGIAAYVLKPPVHRLLARAGLAPEPDPVAHDPFGVFADPAIQALYDELLARGSVSLVDALMVGATIEDLDIVDLRERATDTPDIARVYANLEQGSRNHLRAFVTNLTRRGATYTPTDLTLDEFDAIVSSSQERGGQGGPDTSARPATRKAVRP